ncbi:hypothetical protein GCM10025868_42290 [Angustibacter aerolatus]|uniref:Uncharacterized protein n=1 Tax=Angustibacter aerolatus TaxID=1162965 RepID=A0ABQ6JM52_9ACTN|nr:hypothetical protein GCM10025868_42290 [Angustibacter aerolatus]
MDATRMGTRTAVRAVPIEPIEPVDHGLVAEAATALAGVDAFEAFEAARPAASTGAGWAARPAQRAAVVEGLQHRALQGRDAIAVGAGVRVPWHLVEPTVRFPVLTSWSFTCTDAGDFQTLATTVTRGCSATSSTRTPRPRTRTATRCPRHPGHHPRHRAAVEPSAAAGGAHRARRDRAPHAARRGRHRLVPRPARAGPGRPHDGPRGRPVPAGAPQRPACAGSPRTAART